MVDGHAAVHPANAVHDSAEWIEVVQDSAEIPTIPSGSEPIPKAFRPDALEEIGQGQAISPHNSLYGDFSVKSLVRVSASFSLSLSTACTQTNRGTVDRKVEAGVNPDQEQGEQYEGNLPWGAQHRAATLYSVGSARDPDHKAVNGFSSKAPRRRAHSADGIGAMELFGSPPPRIATPGVAATGDPSRNNPVACSGRRP
jgi:hypothetical protein